MAILETARENVVSVAPGTPVEEIAQTMFAESVGSVIVEEDGELEGIITDRDVVVELLTGAGAANIFEDPSAAADLTAQDLMTSDPLTVDHEMELPKVLREMEDAGARRIPVTKDGTVVGIVSLDDVLTQVAGESEQVSAELQSLASVVRKESPAG
jgi:CBS domain-containing protein